MSTSPASPPRQQLYLLESWRGFGCIAVVLHHIGAIGARGPQAEYFGGFFQPAHLWLDFFFVLSGFLIAWLHAGDVGRAGRAGPFLLKRFLRTWPLLCILTTVKFAALLALVTGGSNRGELDLQQIVSSYLMLPMEEGYPLILAAWTMPYEVTFYVFFATLMLMSRRWLVLLAGLWAAAIVLCHLLLPADSVAFPGSFYLNPYHLQTLGGMAVGLLLKRVPPGRYGGPVLAAGILLLACGLLGYVPHLAWTPLGKRAFWGLVFCILIAGSVLYEMGRTAPLRLPWLLRLMGRASYSVYLVHSPIIVVLLGALGSRGWLHGVWKEVWMTAAGLVGVLAGLACHQWLEKPLLTLTQQWVKRPQPDRARTQDGDEHDPSGHHRGAE